MILKVNVNGWNINYEAYGKEDGTPVVFLHGWLTDMETMRPLADSLSNNFKVYLIDVVGFGKSDLPKEPLTSDDFGNFLKELLEKIKIDNPILVGHSNGGRIILNALGRQIVNARKIVLIDSAGLKPKRNLSYHIKVSVFKVGKIFLNLIPSKEFRLKLRNKVGSSDYKASPEVLKDTMKIILNEDHRALLPNIKVPTLLIWGGRDTATPISDAREMEKAIPNCGLVEYPYGSHFSYLENIENCKAVLNEFLKNDK